MFKGESDRIGEAISTVVFLSLCIILIFSAISIFISLILDISKQLLINEILTRITLSIALFGFGFFPLRIWQKRNEVNEEKEYWQVLKQSFNDSIDTETLKKDYENLILQKKLEPVKE